MENWTKADDKFLLNDADNSNWELTVSSAGVVSLKKDGVSQGSITFGPSGDLTARQLIKQTFQEVGALLIA